MKTLYCYAIAATLMFLGGVQTLYGQCAMFYTDTIFVPDDQSACLESSIFVAETSLTTISSLEQMPDVQINFEHSYMGDLVITLICPNGQSLALHQSGGGNTYLGEPVDNDAAPLEIGVGYDYAWSPDAVLGTWAQESIFHTTLPNGTYASTQPWSTLFGCPVSGDWILEICDLWGSDNGFLFSYGLVWPEETGFSSEDCKNFGCIDSLACNYTGAVFGNTSLCLYFGCTDEDACNYDPSAGCDDGSCVYPGCSISAACNYSQISLITGCFDNNLCIFPECGDPYACNYVADAECNTQSVCVYNTCVTMNHFQTTSTSCASGTITLETYELGPGSYSFEWVVQATGGQDVSSIWVEPYTTYQVVLDEPGMFFTEMNIYTGSFFNCCVFMTGDGFIEVPDYSGSDPMLQFDSEQNELSCSNCFGDNLSYQWYFNSVPVFGATNQTFIPQASGLVYLCIHLDDNPNCSACSEEGYFFVTSTGDIEKTDTGTVFSVQNVVSGGMAVVSQSTETLVLGIYTSTGSFLGFHTVFAGEKHVLENLASGVYLVHDPVSGVTHKCMVL